MKILLCAVITLYLTASVSAQLEKLYTFDLTYTRELTDQKRIWDETHFVSTLQGIVNRNSPKLYVFFTGTDGATDQFWLKKMQDDGFLKDREIVPVKDIESLARIFKREIKGIVAYDNNVPATSNVASTVAGVENLAAVRYDSAPNSLFTRLVKDTDGPKILVKRWLVNADGTSIFTGSGFIPGTKTPSTGSAKCDAYIWAKEKYLDTGKCDPRIMGYYVDSYCIPQLQGIITPFHTLVNHDYIVARKGFIFDLSPWDDETPVDDRNQKIGTDCSTMLAILKSAYNRLNGKEMISVSGYIPLWFKYTNIANSGGKHEPVYCEFRLAGLLTSHNAFMDADAIDRPAMANASVFFKYPLKPVYKQPKPTLDTLRVKGYIDSKGNVSPKAYVSFYIGDYDSAAWMYQMVPKLWDDPARGSIPLGWAFNPNLAARFPFGMHYVRTNASPNDYFTAGASGAGYLHPGYLVSPRTLSGLPSGVDAWKRHCKRWMKKFDISITGFIIDGTGPSMRDTDTLPDLWDAYAEISPDGVAGQFMRDTGVHKGMPYIPMEWQYEVLGSERLYTPIPDNAYQSYVKLIVNRASKVSPSFAYYRTILWRPSEIKTLMDTVKSMPEGKDIEFVDPYTLMLLIKQFNTIGQNVILLGHGIWELGVSAEVTSHSKVVDGYDIRDIFGRGFGRIENKAVAFEDGVSEPFTHWVEWMTKQTVRINSFNLFARGDRVSGREDIREFNGFRLYGKRNPEDQWTQLDSYVPSHPFTYLPGQGDDPVRTVELKEPFTGKYFRAEFDQYDSKLESRRGPRIVEMEGIGALIE
ncbi:MAG: GxGYxYP domain-containing protein [Armatimonadota bacterium]